MYYEIYVFSENLVKTPDTRLQSYHKAASIMKFDLLSKNTIQNSKDYHSNKVMKNNLIEKILGRAQ